jgi:GTPase
VTNRNNSQVIVYDTPGLVTPKEMKKHQLSQKFITSCHESIKDSDIIGVLHDVSNHFTRGAIDPILLQLLKKYQHIPSFLIFNKIDKLKSKRTLLDLVKTLTCNNISLDKKRGKPKAAEIVEDKPPHKDQEWEKKVEVGWADFKAVFMVSSLTGDGIEKVFNFVESRAVERSWEFKNNEITDQTPEKLIEEFVRARLLDYLPQEIPYLLKVTLEYFSNENNKIFASVIVSCANERHEKLVCGVSDGKLRQITDRVTSDLIQHFQQSVSLTLSTVVAKHPSH